MKHIQVLGPGCPNCNKLADQTMMAANDLGLEHYLEKVTDMREIMKFGVMSTPALVVDGVVKVSGRVPTMEELKKMLQ
jgi:small redox-active disulfide protein 2